MHVLDPAAERDGVRGTLVRLDPDAAIQSISIETSSDQRNQQKCFVQAVDETLRASTFRRQSGGRELAAAFDFRLSERREDDGRVVFDPPNRFEIFDTRPTVNFDGSRP